MSNARTIADLATAIELNYTDGVTSGQDLG